MSHVEDLAGKFLGQDAFHITTQSIQLHHTVEFFEANSAAIFVADNYLKRLLRESFYSDYIEKVSADILFLWSQAKLAEELAKKQDDNKISGFNVGAGIGVYLPNPQRGGFDFYFSSGANQEPHNFSIGTHAESSAIQVLRRELAPVCATENQRFTIDLVAISKGAPPCGSCREEIFTHRSSDNTLVAIISDEGKVTLKTISELFPTHFPEIDLEKIPRDILTVARNSARKYIPSDYQQDDVLPRWGVAIRLKNGQIIQGMHTGDAAFWPNSPSLDAIGKVKRKQTKSWSKRTYIYNRTEGLIALQEINQVVFYYEGPQLSYYPNGTERQQLADLPDDTEVIIVEGTTNRTFRTTKGELIPAAFTA